MPVGLRCQTAFAASYQSSEAKKFLPKAKSTEPGVALLKQMEYGIVARISADGRKPFRVQGLKRGVDKMVCLHDKFARFASISGFAQLELVCSTFKGRNVPDASVRIKPPVTPPLGVDSRYARASSGRCGHLGQIMEVNFRRHSPSRLFDMMAVMVQEKPLLFIAELPHTLPA